MKSEYMEDYYLWDYEIDGVTSYIPCTEQGKKNAFTHSCPIPEFLLWKEPYCRISDGAKIVYAAMLDRMGTEINSYLKYENRHNVDHNNNTLFIEFPITEVKDTLCCGTSKAIKCVHELEAVHLIKRRGRGRDLSEEFFLYTPLIDD